MIGIWRLDGAAWRQGARFRAPRAGLVQRRPLASGYGLCIRCLVPVRGFLIPRIPRGALKEETMTYQDIALMITAFAQLVAAIATVIGVIREGP